MKAASDIGPPLLEKPVPVANMRRDLSSESGRIYSAAAAAKGDAPEVVLQGSSRAVLLGLFAVKFSHRSKRISDAEKTAVKMALSNRCEIDPAILSKMNESEQTAVLLALPPKSFKDPAKSGAIKYALTEIVHLAELNVAERAELESLRKLTSKKVDNSDNRAAATAKTCSVCADEDLADDFVLTCPNTATPHFICNHCVTAYVRSLNESVGDTAFQSRKGKVCCPEMDCKLPYVSGALCQHLTDPAVGEAYIDGLQLYQKVSLVQNYTEQILLNLEEVGKLRRFGT